MRVPGLRIRRRTNAKTSAPASESKHDLAVAERIYGGDMPTRSVLIARTAEGVKVMLEKHAGGAGPPRRSEAERLRDCVEDINL
jgi:hypothetical protein